MDFNQCLQEFKNYVKKFNLENDKINRKYYHSFRVVEYCEKIATSLNMNDEYKFIAKLIGLLHDIGRFEQIKTYDTFKDSESVDHALVGIEILKKDNYINKYIQDKDNQQLVLKAIDNHNKKLIDKNLTEIELLFSKLIRDADKLDIFYLLTVNNDKKEDNDLISPKVLNDFLAGNLVDNKDVQNSIDLRLSKLCWFFEINFSESFKIIKEKNYVNILIDKLYEDFVDQKEIIDLIKNKLKIYLKEKGEISVG